MQSFSLQNVLQTFSSLTTEQLLFLGGGVILTLFILRHYWVYILVIASILRSWFGPQLPAGQQVNSDWGAGTLLLLVVLGGVGFLAFRYRKQVFEALDRDGLKGVVLLAMDRLEELRKSRKSGGSSLEK